MEDGGSNLLRAEGLFRNLTREGVLAYVSRWIKNGRLGLERGRERKGGTGRNSGVRGGTAMAGGKEVTGERVTWPTGLGLRIQEHRMREGVRANSPRLRERPEERAEAAVAMVGDAELLGAHETGPRSHENRN